MKNTFLFLFATAAIAVVASCNNDELLDPNDEFSIPSVIYTAKLIGENTKAVLGENENERKQSFWSVGDKITLHNGVKGFDFIAMIKESSVSSEFAYEGNDFSATDGVIAIYPSGEYAVDVESLELDVNIPSVQVATKESYDPSAAVAVAYSQNQSLSFYNVASLLQFTVKTDNVKSVVFTTSGTEAISGNADVALDEDGTIRSVTASSAQDKATSVELIASGNDYFEKGKTYYISLIPTNFKNGFSVSFRFIEGGTKYLVKKYDGEYNLRRNVILNIGDLSYDTSGLDADVAPVLSSFKFLVANNPGKILGKKLYYDASSKTTKFSSVEEEIFSINSSENIISAYIPYLNNRMLVPTFEIPKGTSLVYEGQEVISGKTQIDFSVSDKIAVTNGKEERIYTIQLSNTGLPIVVINQNSGTVSEDTDPEFAAAGNGWWNATGTKWQLKESDWLMTEGQDDFMVYYADGSSALADKNGNVIDLPVLSSTRERGNVSRQLPKKPFAVKLDKKHSVLGLPAHKRWVLLANWKDRTLMRNDVAFAVADAFKQTFPNDGIAWNPSGKFVELVYNGVHVGNYYLCEQIKIDAGRLDINDPYDVDDAYSGVASDYGYLLECDDGYDENWKFMTKMYIPFLFKDDGNDQMLSYVQDIVRDIEKNLYNGEFDAAYSTLELTSVVDFLLIQELMMNSELQHPKSCYMYINNGKLYAGPIWDFDWNTLPSEGYFECSYSYSESILEDSSPRWYNYFLNSSRYPSVDGGDKCYMWYPLLVKNQKFKDLAAERWNKVKNALNSVSVRISNTADYIRKSEACNYSMWPVDIKSENIRGNVYGISGGNVVYCGYCGDEAMTFDEAVAELKKNFEKRISGMSYVSNKQWPSKSVEVIRFEY